MKRREFNLAAVAAASVTACGGGGGDIAAGPPAPAPAPGPARPPTPAPAPAPVPPGAASIGTNLASMELTGESAIRFGGSTLPNVNYAVPRREELQYMRDHGFTKNRLPIRWEMLQPVLFDTRINDATAEAISEGLDIDEESASAIVKFRGDKGPFREWKDLLKVPGIDAKRIEEMKDTFDFSTGL